MAKTSDLEKDILELDKLEESLKKLFPKVRKKNIDESKLSNIMANEIVAYSFQYTPYDFARDLSYGEATEAYRVLDNRLRTGKYQRMHSKEMTTKVAKGKYTFSRGNKDLKYKNPIGFKRTILKNMLSKRRISGSKDSMVRVPNKRTLASRITKKNSSLRKYNSLSSKDKKYYSAYIKKQLDKKSIADFAGLKKEHLRNTVYVNGNVIGYTAPYAGILYNSPQFKYQQANGRKQVDGKIGALWLDKTWDNHSKDIEKVITKAYEYKVIERIDKEIDKIGKTNKVAVVKSNKGSLMSEARNVDKADFKRWIMKHVKNPQKAADFAWEVSEFKPNEWEKELLNAFNEYLNSR